MSVITFLRLGLVVMIVTLQLNFIKVQADDSATDVNSSSTGPVTVELMIVLDQKFSSWFGHNRQKAIDYFAVYLWDINMRFKTLQTVDISFRVTSLVTIKDKTEQPFIEEVRLGNGSIKMDDIFPKFTKWVYKNGKESTDFDVAILVIGEDAVDAHEGIEFYPAAACRKDDNSKTHYSTLVLTSKHLWGHSCGFLEQALGSVLGAPLDSEDNSTSSCKSQKSIMNFAECSAMQYFFSKCSDDGIKEYLESNKSSCLHTSKDVSKDVLDSASMVIYPPTISDQCVMLTENPNATIVEAKNMCVNVSCYAKGKHEIKFVKTIHPVDNTPCGSEKFCFRGRCLPKGFQIQNVGSGKCLHASSRFGSDDNLIAKDCMNSPTPLDKFMLLEKDGLSGKLFATPYSLQETEENADKCVSVEMTKGVLQYQKCLTTDPKSLEWEMIKVGNNGEFVLFHRNTNTCAKMEDYFNVGITNECSRPNKWMLWKLDDGQILSKGWFSINSNTKIEEEEDGVEAKEIKTVYVSTFGWTEAAAAVGFLLFGVVLGVVSFIELSKCMNRRKSTRVQDNLTVAYTRDSNI